MYCLEVIHDINSKATKRAIKSAVQTRDCSYQVSKRGIVIHSAKCRDTVFIQAGERADWFLRIVRRYEAVKNQAAVNNFIERTYANNCA